MYVLNVIIYISVCGFCINSSLVFACIGLSLRDVTDDVGSGDSVDSYVEPGTVPFG